MSYEKEQVGSFVFGSLQTADVPSRCATDCQKFKVSVFSGHMCLNKLLTSTKPNYAANTLNAFFLSLAKCLCLNGNSRMTSAVLLNRHSKEICHYACVPSGQTSVRTQQASPPHYTYFLSQLHQTFVFNQPVQNKDALA